MSNEHGDDDGKDDPKTNWLLGKIDALWLKHIQRLALICYSKKTCHTRYSVGLVSQYYSTHLYDDENTNG